MYSIIEIKNKDCKRGLVEMLVLFFYVIFMSKVIYKLAYLC
nr:MAG TPA: hypothetical protein [Caudoviricetes sp.]